MQDYSVLSDFDVNKRVAKVLGYAIHQDGVFKWDEDMVLVERGDEVSALDFCNDIEDAWPVMLRYKISLILEDGQQPCAYGNMKMGQCCAYWDQAVEAENPLRAAMIVFLQMNDAK